MQTSSEGRAAYAEGWEGSAPRPVFDRALKLTLGFEGGTADVAGDRGGLTRFGITQKVYDRWRRWMKLPTRPVTQIDDSEVRDVYRNWYWAPAHCDDLPDGLAVCMFDAAVHHGHVRALTFLQQALGVTPAAGHFGPKTRAAVDEADELDTIIRFLDARQDFLDQIVESDPSQVKFRKGWNNRIASLRDQLTHERIA